MGRNKDSYIRLLKKVCEKYYPNLLLNSVECIETSKFDHSTSSWEPYGYSIFICIKHTLEYNIYDIECFIESILGCELIITEQ